MARATKWTDEKIKAQRLILGQTERRVLVEPGLYLHIRARTDSTVAKHWQFRAQVETVRRWLSLGGYPAVSLAEAKRELLKH